MAASMTVKQKKLSAKQLRFIDEFLIDLNGTQAAIRSGYSPKSARTTAARMLANDNIQAAISARQATLSKQTGITQERVLQELASIGFSDIRQVLTADGHLLKPDEWPDEIAVAISGVEIVTNSTGKKDKKGRREIEHTHKLKVWDKVRALENIAKHLGMLVNKHDHTSSDGSMTPVSLDVAKLSKPALKELMDLRRASKDESDE